MAGAAGGLCFPISCDRQLDKFKALGNEAGACAHILQFLAFAYLVTFVIHHLLAPKFDQIKPKAA